MTTTALAIRGGLTVRVFEKSGGRDYDGPDSVGHATDGAVPNAATGGISEPAVSDKAEGREPSTET